MPRDIINQKTFENNQIIEAPRTLDIRGHYDVIVAGGGPAGVGAALAAAREGAKTLLIEQYGMLGGVWTAGLLNPFFENVGRGYLVDELCHELTQQNAFCKWREHDYCFDIETMARTLEQLMLQADVDLLYYTRVADTIVDNDRVAGLVIESKAGRQAVTANVTIDTTGDGDVFARAGCEYELGRASDGMLQPMTLMFEISGLPADYEQVTSEGLYDQMITAIEQHGLGYKLPFPRYGAAPWIISTPTPGVSDMQCTHVYQLNPLDPAQLTKGTIECRTQAAEIVDILNHIPGFESVQLTHSAAQIGIREARRLRGKYYMEVQDLIDGRRFDDAVTSCGFVIDVHQSGDDPVATQTHKTRIKPYEIPYRSLIPAEMRGLLAAGRCISGSHEAHASYRCTGTAMGLGQAAGIAAAWATRDNLELDAVDGQALHAEIKKRGAKFADEITVLHQD